MDVLQPGYQLDHYRIEDLAAQSGMSCVYRAMDIRDDRVVAIKVPHLEVESDPLLFDRFLREEQIGKSLEHPGVMRVFENEGRSRIYMVMEWIDGRLLREIVDEQKVIPIERAVGLTIQLCEALAYVHEHGVVHRDLKPGNIMVDSTDRIKLIDFGIAGYAKSRRLTYGKLTRAMGTPDYVSPEQARSKRGDGRSDVYAVGVILYEMLTGELPFPSPNPLVAINARLLNQPIPPREINPEISPALQEILYRALERDSAKRYASAREFAHDLRHPDSVGVVEREELRDWEKRRFIRPKTVAIYIGLAMIPILMLALLLIVARRP
jgi:serine/threonine-protein kinase